MDIGLGVGDIVNGLVLLYNKIIKGWLWEEFILKRCKKEIYFIENASKQVIVHENGHGVIINTLRIRVLNPDKFGEFTRKWDFTNDAAVSMTLPDFNVLKATNRTNRFHEAGIWLESDFINYFDGACNGKKVDFKVKINTLKVVNEKKKYIDVSYAISSPKMYPIAQGKADIQDMPLPESDYIFNTSLTIRKRTHHIAYELLIEKGVKLDGVPQFISTENGFKNKERILKHVATENVVFYNRFYSEAKSPKFGTKIHAQWKVLKN